MGDGVVGLADVYELVLAERSASSQDRGSVRDGSSARRPRNGDRPAGSALRTTRDRGDGKPPSTASRSEGLSSVGPVLAVLESLQELGVQLVIALEDVDRAEQVRERPQVAAALEHDPGTIGGKWSTEAR